MLQAILLDLDDTLLANNMEDFLPRYFQLMAGHARKEGLTFDLVSELITCTNQVIRDTSPTRSNREVFWELFGRRTGLERAAAEQFFDRFYTEEFPTLREVTGPDPVAPRLVRWCLARGWSVVVATNPLFPTTAVEQRLAWAGLPVDQFDFSLVTTFDNMHAAKPQEAYYREILERVGVPAEGALMVGDDWANDIVPAAALGCATFWICRPGSQPPDPELALGHGSLADLFDRLGSGWLQAPAAAGS